MNTVVQYKTKPVQRSDAGGIKPHRCNNNYTWLELASHKETDVIEVIAVEWPSYWHDVLVQILITATRIDKNNWRLLSMGIPKDTPLDDVEEIEQSSWFIAPSLLDRKYPPIQMAWYFQRPSIYILACDSPDKAKRIPLNEQLSQMISEPKPDPAKYSIINALRRLGPGNCTVISELGPFKIQITEDGLFRSPVFPTDFKMLTDSQVPEDVSPHVATYLGALIMLTPTVMIVCTLTDETVCVKKDQNSIMPVAVKELRGFQTELIVDTNGEQYISWRKLTPVETRRLYELDNDTNGSFEFEVKEREYRFVQ